MGLFLKLEMKLSLEKINEAINSISNSIDQGEWVEALLGSEMIE